LLIGPTAPWLSCAPSASTPANRGAASDVPSLPFIVMSGTARLALPVIDFTPS
jgi:hypothetical protein